MKRRSFIASAVAVVGGWFGLKRKSPASRGTPGQVFGAAHEAGIRFHLSWHVGWDGLPEIKLTRYWQEKPGSFELACRRTWSGSALTEREARYPVQRTVLVGRDYDELLQSIADELSELVGLQPEQKQPFEAALERGAHPPRFKPAEPTNERLAKLLEKQRKREAP